MIDLEIQNAILNLFNNESLESRFIKHLFATGVYPKTADGKFPDWLNFDIIQNIKIRINKESINNNLNYEWMYAIFELIEGNVNWKDYQTVPSSK
jgi:hypothetical protein